ncbi:MAG: mechanosensitive ion channel family protein [Opitutales bacterium]|nr:mechanosensitive ion channel family protein [Opitutales bacterium]
MITQMMIDAGWSQPLTIAVSLIAVLAIILGLWSISILFANLMEGKVKKWAGKTKNRIDDFLVGAKVFRSLAQIVVALLLYNYLSVLFVGEKTVEHLTELFGNAYFVVALAYALCAFLDAWIIYISKTRVRSLPLKGFVQAVKYIVVAGAALCLLAIFTGTSPLYILSGLGAAMAVLLIVFKDSLLGLTAGLTIMINDLVRKDDWIEIPGQAVDGVVNDITLTTVKIINWDNTVACVPSYTLVSTSIRNWRGMTDAKARRIKRAFRVDLRTIHIATEEEIAKLKSAFPQIETSFYEIPQTTNLALFRAFCKNYLKNHPGIRNDLSVIVRQLDSDVWGLPIEIYAFSKTTDFEPHEELAARLIEYFITVAPEFSLKIHQR